MADALDTFPDDLAPGARDHAAALADARSPDDLDTACRGLLAAARAVRNTVRTIPAREQARRATVLHQLLEYLAARVEYAAVHARAGQLLDRLPPDHPGHLLFNARGQQARHPGYGGGASHYELTEALVWLAWLVAHPDAVRRQRFARAVEHRHAIVVARDAGLAHRKRPRFESPPGPGTARCAALTLSRAPRAPGHQHDGHPFLGVVPPLVAAPDRRA